MQLLVHDAAELPCLQEHTLHVQPVPQLLLLLDQPHDPESGRRVLLGFGRQPVELTQGTQKVPELSLLSDLMRNGSTGTLIIVITR